MSAASYKSPAPSRLSERRRQQARDIYAHGCGLLLARPSYVHYTEGPERWEGIDRRLLVTRGQVITHGDCSATQAWLLWNALHVAFGLPDIVNGQHWLAGFTGTMLDHGKVVHRQEHLKVGDQIIYGAPGSTGRHVAGYIGGGMVCSHGSEGGPYKLPLHYRPDIEGFRRYI